MMKSSYAGLLKSVRRFGCIFMVSVTIGAGLMTGLLCVAASLSMLLALSSH